MGQGGEAGLQGWATLQAGGVQHILPCSLGIAPVHRSVLLSVKQG